MKACEQLSWPMRSAVSQTVRSRKPTAEDPERTGRPCNRSSVSALGKHRCWLPPSQWPQGSRVYHTHRLLCSVLGNHLSQEWLVNRNLMPWFSAEAKHAALTNLFWVPGGSFYCLLSIDHLVLEEFDEKCASYSNLWIVVNLTQNVQNLHKVSICPLIAV